MLEDQSALVADRDAPQVLPGALLREPRVRGQVIADEVAACSDAHARLEHFAEVRAQAGARVAGRHSPGLVEL